MFGHLDRGFSTAEPVNHTLHVLREFREEFREFVAKTDNPSTRWKRRSTGTTKNSNSASKTSVKRPLAKAY